MPRRHPRQVLRAAPAVLATALVLTGCAEDGEQSASQPSQAPSSATSSAAASGDERATEVSGTVPDVGEPVATRTVKLDGNVYRLDVFPLVAEQGSPGVSVNIRLVFEQMQEPAVRVGLLASQEDQGSVRVRRASGLTVVDRDAGMAYLPARDADDYPLCSPEVPAEAIDGDQLYVTCVFGGFEDDVESLDLVVPNFGTFRDVPFE